MEQTPDPLPLIADDWLIEGQRFLNQRFGDDLQFPIYVIRAPTEAGTRIRRSSSRGFSPSTNGLANSTGSI